MKPWLESINQFALKSVLVIVQAVDMLSINFSYLQHFLHDDGFLVIFVVNCFALHSFLLRKHLNRNLIIKVHDHLTNIRNTSMDMSF